MVKLREGGFYRRRDGQVVGPVIKNEDIERHDYPFCIVQRKISTSYTSDGRYYKHNAVSPCDLIEEVNEMSKLVVEVGKYYARRDDVVVGPIVANTTLTRTQYPFVYEMNNIRHVVTKNGMFEINGKDTVHDLISEVCADKPQEGDTVLVEAIVTAVGEKGITTQSMSVLFENIKQVVKRAPRIEVGSVVQRRTGNGPHFTVLAIHNENAWVESIGMNSTLSTIELENLRLTKADGSDSF